MGKGAGTGHFSDYGSSGEDRCDKAFSVRLEEVEHVPSIGSTVVIDVQEGRISAETSKGVLVGYLPLSTNWMLGCMNDGRSYSGTVSLSIASPVAVVNVDVELNSR